MVKGKALPTKAQRGEQRYSSTVTNSVLDDAGDQRHSLTALHLEIAPYQWEEAGRTTGPVGTGRGNDKLPCPRWDRTPDRPDRGETPYRLRCTNLTVRNGEVTAEWERSDCCTLLRVWQ